MLSKVLKWTFASGAPIKIISPFNGKLIYEENMLTKPQLKTLLVKTAGQRQQWSKKSVQQRRDVLINFVARLKTKADIIAREITLQTGKTITNSTSEVSEAFNVMEKHLTYKLENDGQLREGYTLQPFGNVLIASAYTTPFFTPSKYMVLGLLVGNSVLIKSSDQSLLTTNMIVSTFREVCGLDVIAPLHANLEVMETFLEDKDTGFINFTGLTKSGHELYRQIATKSECFAQSVFHMSASDAAYIRRDADIAHTIPVLAKGALVNSGQSRNAIKRIYVESSKLKEFCDRFVEEVTTFEVGDPMDPNTKLSPIVTEDNFQALLTLKETLKAQPQISLLYEGPVPQQYPNRRFIMPMVYLVKQLNTYRFQNEQIYGPFVFIKGVDDDQNAIEQMNKTVYGKRCVVFTQNWQQGIKIGEKLEVGGFTINNCIVHHPDLPESGRKRSGKGFSLSEDSIRNIGKTLSIAL